MLSQLSVYPVAYNILKGKGRRCLLSVICRLRAVPTAFARTLLFCLVVPVRPALTRTGLYGSGRTYIRKDNQSRERWSLHAVRPGE